MEKRSTVGFHQMIKEFHEFRKSQSPSELLFNFLYTLFKRKYLATAIFFFTFAGIIFGTYLVTPLWKATAIVRVQFNPKQQLTMYEGITTPSGEVPGVNPANDVIQIVNSRVFAEEIVREFGREELWRKRSEAPEKTRDIIGWHIHNILIDKPIGILRYIGLLSKTPENYFAMAVEELQEDLEEIELEEDTTVVDVAVWGESPKIATEMTNSLVGLLLKRNLMLSREPVGLMIQSTEEQFAIAESDLRIAEERLKDFKERTSIISYSDESKILIERLDRYESEVREMEGKLASLKIEKQKDHPEIRVLEIRLKEYNKVFIPAIQSRLAAFPKQEVELARLNHDLQSKQELYSLLKEKLLDLEVLKNTSLGALGLQVIDPAKVYEYVHPDWPRWVINIPLGFIASLLTALSFIFLIEYFDTSFKSVKELEERIPLHTLGAVPYISFFRRKKIQHSLDIETSKTSEIVPAKRNEPRFVTPYDVIANAMFVKNEVPLGKVFLITSPGPGEGKSKLAAILSQTLSRRGKKILLVDTNLRNPAMERIFNVRAEKGIRNLYEEGITLQDVITNVDSLDIAFPGNTSIIPVDPFDLLCGDRFESLIAQARHSYDFIFLDSPSVKISKDPLALVPLVDGVVLVVEANRTQERALLMVKEKIEEMGGVFKGLVLNKQINYVPAVLRAILD